MEIPQWKTVLQQSFLRNGKKYFGVRLSILRESSESVLVSIHIGRYHEDYAGTKFFVSLNKMEVAWLMLVLPEVQKQLLSAKEDTMCAINFSFPGYSEDEDRSFTITGNYFKKSKYMVLKKVVGDRERQVELPRMCIPHIYTVLPDAYHMARLSTEFDFQMEHVEEVTKTLLYTFFDDIRKTVTLKDLAGDLTLIAKSAERGMQVEDLIALEKLQATFENYKPIFELVMDSFCFDLLVSSYTIDYMAHMMNIPSYVMPDTITSKLVVNKYRQLQNERQ